MTSAKQWAITARHRNDIHKRAILVDRSRYSGAALRAIRAREVNAKGETQR